MCDIDPITKNIDAKQIEKLITAKTKAIIPVHYCGYPCDMDEICRIAEHYQLYIVEDCAHAIEAKFKGKHCGSFGEIDASSFYATKNIAIGEGGMCVSNNDALIQRVSKLGLHGLSRDAWRRFESSSRKVYDVSEIGFKMNMTDLQAAIGLVQLKRINTMYERRRRIWELYDSYLTDTGLDLPSLPESHSAHARHLYVVGLPSHVDRDEFIWRASHDYGITMGVHYKSVPTFSAYKHIWNSSDIIANFPIALNGGIKQFH